MTKTLTATAAALLLLAHAFPARPAPSDAAKPFETPVASADLDGAAYAERSGGKEAAVRASEGPAGVLWTQTTAPGWQGLRYGEDHNPGARHLRIGFRSAVQVGAVLVRGGGRLSVLRAGARYPGDLGDESQWLPASRIRAGAATTAEAGDDDYCVWVLPPGTRTRALRFTHVASRVDQHYGGWLGGAYVLPARLCDLAGQAVASTIDNPDAASRLNDGGNNGTWQAWDNGRDGGAEPVSVAHPVVVTLTWPRPVALRGLCALWAGFGAADVLAQGVDKAGSASWRQVASFSSVDNQYPRALGANWLDFGETVTTRAIQLRITAPTRESHPHLSGNTKGGRRVWLGELLAISALGSGELRAAVIPQAAPPSLPHPPIPIRVRLPQAGFVTLVVEDARTGRRVRNLVSETPAKAGLNTFWWDGLDDLGRDPEAPRHGVYQIPARMVAAGTYRVRGLWRKGVHLRYEFSVYSAGSPAWETADGTGGWLTNHTPPQAACHLPADRAPGGKALMYLGSYVSEGGSGLAWTDMEGRKVGGRGWIGGNWTAAPFLCRDDGAKRVKDDLLYVGAPWHVGEDNQKPGVDAELRITALTASGADRPVAKYTFHPALDPGETGDNRWISQMGGMAAHNGLIVISLTRKNELLLIDAATGKVGATGGGEIQSPKGVAFDNDGRLLVVCGSRLLRVTLATTLDTLTPPAIDTLIAGGLAEPYGIALDSSGRIYISERGASHQVKVFAGDGTPTRAIGHPGAPKAGLYDPEHLNNPAGLAVDEGGRVWVTEADYSPKRVSVWSPDGKLLKAFYGPGQYGGGGTLDPVDPSRFYYSGVEFRLDWKAGKSEPRAVFHRPAPGDMPLPDGYGCTGAPETPIYSGGRRYLTNCYTSNPTNGASVATVWMMRGDVARPVAAAGRAGDWSLLSTAPFRARWPAGLDPTGNPQQNQALFVWSDLNGDAHAQPNEVQMIAAGTGGVVVTPDLGFAIARVETGGAKPARRAMLFAPVRTTAAGVPVYDLAKGRVLTETAQAPTSSGGDQALLCPDGWAISTVAPAPFAPEGLGGSRGGKALWSYPSLWPGLHASHESPPPDRAGELIGTTRLLGPCVTPRAGEAGPLWCINGNMGSMYLLTSDGLFVATLFRDIRQGRSWSMPSAQRGMLLDEVSPHDENFWPSISQTPDGAIYLVDGGRSSLVKVEGLDTVRRLPATTIRLTMADLRRAQAWQAEAEAARQRSTGANVLRVAHLAAAPGLDAWAGADWARIDRRGVAAWFDSNSKPYDVTAAVAIAGDRLYALYRTGDAEILRNTGEVPLAPFKTGGALDIMLGTNPSADPARRSPVAGDVRLTVTQVKGVTRALIYRPIAPGTSSDRRVPFSSPWRTITFDRVDDVSDEVTLHADGHGAYLMSAPLAVLGLKPTAGASIRADIGILRGNGFQTLQRVYWSNKATGITSDVPSEAELIPNLWGKWEFE